MKLIILLLVILPLMPQAEEDFLGIVLGDNFKETFKKMNLDAIIRGNKLAYVGGNPQELPEVIWHYFLGNHRMSGVTSTIICTYNERIYAIILVYVDVPDVLQLFRILKESLEFRYLKRFEYFQDETIRMEINRNLTIALSISGRRKITLLAGDPDVHFEIEVLTEKRKGN